MRKIKATFPTRAQQSFNGLQRVRVRTRLHFGSLHVWCHIVQDEGGGGVRWESGFYTADFLG